MRRLLLLLAAALICAAAPSPRPIVLAPQPGTPLDAAARQLAADDMADASRAGDKPLVLVGSAKLGSGPHDRAALFVQLQSARECGSAGCSTSVFLWQHGTWHRVLDGVSGKLTVSTRTRHGMADLVSDNVRYAWNGRIYKDTRPAPAIDLRPRAPHPRTTHRRG